MLSKEMLAGLNDQISKEMHSAYLYMAMSARSADLGLEGFARWFMIQYHEEMFHGMKIYKYIQDRGGEVVLKDIPAPEGDFPSVREMFEKTLAHEKTVTRSILDLLARAKAEKDAATEIFLAWYVTEQVEEEKTASDILRRFAYMGPGENPGCLFLDRAMGERKLEAPTDFSELVI